MRCPGARKSATTPPGDRRRPLHEYLFQITTYYALFGWDVAQAYGVPVTVPDALVAGLDEGLAPRIDDWRAGGIFPAAVPVAAGASRWQQVLGLTGRPSS